MAYNIDFSVAAASQIEQALCGRLEQIRLARNVTQADLAREAGVSERTMRRMEKGEGASLDTFIRVVSVLGLQQNLAGLLPDPAVRPVDRVRRGVTERQRARPSASPEGPETTWTWGDEG